MEASQSISRVSHCIDNSPMEGFWGALKSEIYYLKKLNTYKELRQAINEYIEFYNTKRLQKKLKDMTPIEYRNHTLSTYIFYYLLCLLDRVLFTYYKMLIFISYF
ncbi:IS3 family transposase [Clostridium sp. UBA1056]|uniref:IS3 family transposase n=1 Tax=Clostridium sp. UBA1056 TaxID=1946346 RepID=UPI0039C8A286